MTWTSDRKAFTAICLTCSWRGPWRLARAEAVGDAAEHYVCPDYLAQIAWCAVVDDAELARGELY